MEMTSPLCLRVLLFRDLGVWMAQALEHDLSAHGSNPKQGLDRLAEAVGAVLAHGRTAGGSAPAESTEADDRLVRVPPAAPECWEQFEQAAMTARVEVETFPMPGTTMPALFVQAFAAAAPALRKSA